MSKCSFPVKNTWKLIMKFSNFCWKMCLLFLIFHEYFATKSVRVGSNFCTPVKHRQNGKLCCADWWSFFIDFKEKTKLASHQIVENKLNLDVNFQKIPEFLGPIFVAPLTFSSLSLRWAARHDPAFHVLQWKFSVISWQQSAEQVHWVVDCTIPSIYSVCQSSVKVRHKKRAKMQPKVGGKS